MRHPVCSPGNYTLDPKNFPCNFQPVRGSSSWDKYGTSNIKDSSCKSTIIHFSTRTLTTKIMNKLQKVAFFFCNVHYFH
jgi:hypothetical protein